MPDNSLGLLVCHEGICCMELVSLWVCWLVGCLFVCLVGWLFGWLVVGWLVS